MVCVHTLGPFELHIHRIRSHITQAHYLTFQSRGNHIHMGRPMREQYSLPRLSQPKLPHDAIMSPLRRIS